MNRRAVVFVDIQDDFRARRTKRWGHLQCSHGRPKGFLSEITVSSFIEHSFVITRLWLENMNVERVFESNSCSERIDFAVAPVQGLHEIPC
ncbi:MAG: hypothetical protein VX189_02430 [Planctomycetota bacterium]|nr:hypothetical protein [Planctomycetota bacterium]